MVTLEYRLRQIIKLSTALSLAAVAPSRWLTVMKALPNHIFRATMRTPDLPIRPTQLPDFLVNLLVVQQVLQVKKHPLGYRLSHALGIHQEPNY